MVSERISDDTGFLLTKKLDKILPPLSERVRRLYQPEDDDTPAVLHLLKPAEGLLGG